MNANSALTFSVATGQYFYLNSVSTSDTSIIECHSSNSYSDTNPYIFVADSNWINVDGVVKPWLVDDGSFGNSGIKYYGAPSIFLQMSDNSGNSYWKIINSTPVSKTYSLQISLLQM